MTAERDTSSDRPRNSRGTMRRRDVLVAGGTSISVLLGGCLSSRRLLGRPRGVGSDEFELSADAIREGGYDLTDYEGRLEYDIGVTGAPGSMWLRRVDRSGTVISSVRHQFDVEHQQFEGSFELEHDRLEYTIRAGPFPIRVRLQFEIY